MNKLFTVTVLVTTLLLGGNTHAGQTLLRTYFQNDAPPRYYEIDSINTGICIDIINEINARLAIKGIVIVNIESQKAPTKRIIHYLNVKEEIELFVGGAKTKTRLRGGAQFSIPLYPLNGTFAKRQDNPFVFVDKASLKGLTVGVLRGSRSVVAMTNITDILVEQSDTMEQSLKKLAAGRIDLVYYHDMGLAWQIKSFKLDDRLELVNQHDYIESNPHHIIYSKNVAADVIEKIDVVIESMQTDGSMALILDKY
ncbi:MAG: ABC transporter substrate-binding protein [Kangiellaceae bacterium]|nr:ABC transporter substrate-binding protein [Kangiellaceae bacterium]